MTTIYKLDERQWLFEKFTKEKNRHFLLAYSLIRKSSEISIPVFLKEYKKHIEIIDALSIAEINFFRFFETLGQDLSLLPHVYIEKTKKNKDVWNEIAVPQQCHDTAKMMVYVHNEKKPNDRLKAWYGLIDTYNQNKHTGTHTHSFITANNDGETLVDPGMIRNILNHEPGWHANHFGIYLPYSILKELDQLIKQEQINVNYSGYFNRVIFGSTDKTDMFIEKLLPYKLQTQKLLVPTNP